MDWLTFSQSTKVAVSSAEVKMHDKRKERRKEKKQNKINRITTTTKRLKRMQSWASRIPGGRASHIP